MKQPAPGKSTLVAALILGCAIAAVYGRSVRAPFIFDDEDAVLTNRSIERLWPLVGDDQRRGPLNPEREISTSGRPLVNVSLAINYHFGGYNPFGYHVFNVMVHWLAALLLWGTVHRTLRQEPLAARFAGAAERLALISALLWAVHPLATEAVEYVTQRTELLMALAYLGTLYASLRYWAAATPRLRNVWLALAALACLAGMASKEVMVSAPLAVLLYQRTFVTGSFRRAVTQSWPLYAALMLSWVLLIALNVAGPRSGSAGFDRGVPLLTWWLTQSRILFIYLRLVVWPWPLSIHHSVPYLETIAAGWPWLLAAALVGFGTLVLVVRRFSAGFPLACVLMILAPTFVVPIITEVAAERRMYLPLAALFSLFVSGAYALVEGMMGVRLASGTADRRALTAISLACGALGLVYSAISIERLAVYNDPIVLWQDALAHQPDNAVARTNLGVSLARAGRGEEALLEYQAAMRLDPDSRGARVNMAKLYYNQSLPLLEAGKVDDAVVLIERAFSVDPNSADAHYAMGTILSARGDPRAAAEHYAAAVKNRADFVAAQINLGIARVSFGDFAGAATEFADVLHRHPENSDASFGLGIALARQGKSAEAERQFSQVTQLDPRRAEAYFELGNLLAARGDFTGAEGNYRQAVAIRPDYVDALHNLGAAFLETGQIDQAIARFQEVLGLQPDNQQAAANLRRAREMLSRPPSQ